MVAATSSPFMECNNFPATRSRWLRARMKFPMNFAEPVASDVRVNLRRADIGVTEQFLDHPQICAMLQQMRRKAVPQHVWRDVALHARAANAIFDMQPQRYGLKRRAAFS